MEIEGANMVKSKVEPDFNFKDSIAVFDAGIGSYTIVELLQEYYPKQNVLYLADRAHFPYGDKSKSELAEIIHETIRYLEQYEPKAIIVASNAPSVMVLDEIKDRYNTPIYGIKPPLNEAIEQSKDKHIAVLGAACMIESQEMKHYIQNTVDTSSAVVHPLSALEIIGLVEAGAFINRPAEVKQQLKDFIEEAKAIDPKIDVFTLSSTHLPWVKPYLTILYPEFKFIDPARHVVENLKDITVKGRGEVKGIVTTCEDYSLENFEDTLKKLNIEIDVEAVEL